MVFQSLLVVFLLYYSVGGEDFFDEQHQTNVDIEETHHHEIENVKNQYSQVNSKQIKENSEPVDRSIGENADSSSEAKTVIDENDQSDEISDMSSEKNEESVSAPTRDNTEVFSLTNFIKGWLNPVLQEFQLGLNVANKDKNETTVEILNTTQLDNETSVNNTKIDTKNITDVGKRVKFNCTGRNVTENTTAVVRLVNSSVLLDFLTFDKKNDSTDCIVIMFYAPWCKFCARTAAQFSALGRAFIQLDVLAVDAVHFSNLNARFGTVAVPNIMVFHNSRSAVRFNQTERTFEKLAEFVTNVTGLEPNKSIKVEELDYIGPLSSIPTVEPDYLLWCAWIFVLLCSSHMFINSQYGQNAIEKVRTLWQEHQHIE